MTPVRAATMDMPTKAERQPIHSLATANGKPARENPIWLSANTQLSAVLQDWRGYQRETSTTADMKLPAQPRPTMKRATASPVPVSASACRSAPATMKTDRAETVMRGPTRSKRTPTKICGRRSSQEEAAARKPQGFRGQGEIADELRPDDGSGGAEELRQDGGACQHRHQHGGCFPCDGRKRGSVARRRRRKFGYGVALHCNSLCRGRFKRWRHRAVVLRRHRASTAWPRSGPGADRGWWRWRWAR